MLGAYPAQEMEAFAVGTKVNSPAIDSPECLEPARVEMPGEEQRGLFD
jgi:putative SOS response-associated peptidase YedK